ncbi:MAG: hypothetical protein ABJF11_16760 [Reichenbachiella sp.]|uniref:hypothetical protein n=1 Tax=Reichenbachiella sp. TaxID=2184521 RepID=UPI0032678890
MQELDIKQESYFPQNFKFFGIILIIGAILAISSADSVTIVRGITSLVLLLIGILILSARYGLKINIDQRTYTVYTLLLGFKVGTPEKFDCIEKFYINQVTEKAQLSTRTGAKYDIKSSVYKAFFRVDTGEKIHLDTDKKEKKLAERLEQYKLIVSSIYRPVDQ